MQLGDKISASIDTRYYFGAPVTNAIVKYKVTRVSHSSNWFPTARWDWMYGNGYWWFANDYDWYPGFDDWGCRRPVPPWWGGRNFQQPEIVLESEMPVGNDGKVEVMFDTATAKLLHGNQDHKYTITAEVTDQSRRTIVGQGNVLVSRKAFKVYTWLDKGHYRTDDTIRATFRAQTLDQKAVEGKGELTLFQITYNDKQQPVEKAVQTWKLDTNVEGEAVQQGQSLIELAGADVRAQERSLFAQWVRLEAQKARLEAEATGMNVIQRPARFDSLPVEDQAEASNALRLQTEQMRLRRSVLNAEIDALNQQTHSSLESAEGFRKQMASKAEQEKLISEELESFRDAAEKGFISKSRIRQMERAKADLQGEQGEQAEAEGEARHHGRFQEFTSLAPGDAGCSMIGIN